jgi:hypothetical protein
VSAYRPAIDQSTKTIDTRARYFRNLIVTVVAVALVSIISAAVARTFSPLAGLLFLFPICGFFFVLDAKLLDNWRSHLFEAWIKKDIDLRAFCEAINAVPKLPKDTVHSMLATLPTAEDLLAEQKSSSSTREAVAAAFTGMHARQSDTVTLKAIAAAIVSASAIAAVALRAWKPLLGSLAIFLVPVLGMWLKWKRVAQLKKTTLACRGKSDFSEEKYGELVKTLCGAKDTSLG